MLALERGRQYVRLVIKMGLRTKSLGGPWSQTSGYTKSSLTGLTVVRPRLTGAGADMNTMPRMPPSRPLAFLSAPRLSPGGDQGRGAAVRESEYQYMHPTTDLQCQRWFQW
jgi:hypothetical protein